LSTPILEIKNLHVKADNMEIIRGVDLSFFRGKFYAILGPNGSGKSTIAKTIMGFPEYKVTQGDILFEGKSILLKSITERARIGIAYAFQSPPTIKGVTLGKFICLICSNCGLNMGDGGKLEEGACRPDILKELEKLKISNLKDREINDKFSGGEMKRSELLQVLCMKPKVMILDEPDSGLDYDSLKLVASELKAIKERGDTTVIVVTHHRYILEYVQADRIDVIFKGKKVYTGGMEILPELEKLGYRKFLAQFNSMTL